MTEYRIDFLSSAIGNIDTAYLEESLDFDRKANRAKRTIRFPKLSAACVVLLLILGLSATAFAISRMPLSWRDIFHPNQTVIGDNDEVPIVSEQHTETENLTIDVVKAISDERVLYLLYSVKANEGAVLSPEGRFASFDLYFPDKMMSGAYQQYFLPRKAGVPENELEGVIYADWQPGNTANGLVMTFSNWQEEEWFDDVKVDFNVAEMVENAGENANLPQCLDRFSNGTSRYRWQPGDADVKLSCGVSICNAGWEDGTLQLVMKEPVGSKEWSSWEKNWYFLDARTDTLIYPDSGVHFSQPSAFDPDATDTDWRYFWRTVPVDKEALPYLELHWGGKAIFTTVLPGEWMVTLGETPITVQSEVLAENVPLSYYGEELLAEKIECSKLSMAVYFADYVDSTTGILGAVKIFDANGDAIPCDWGFTADQNDDSCMIWTRFDAPIEPESICKLTFNGETVFAR